MDINKAKGISKNGKIIGIYQEENQIRWSKRHNLQDDVETKDLYNEVSKKFNIYHLDVNHGRRWDEDEIETSYRKYLDDVHFRKVTMDSITNEIVDIIINEAENNVVNSVTKSSGSEEITW